MRTFYDFVKLRTNFFVPYISNFIRIRCNYGPLVQRARRVKKICLWHIFSQSGKQFIIVTRVEDCQRSWLRDCFTAFNIMFSIHLQPLRVCFANPPPLTQGRLFVPNFLIHPYYDFVKSGEQWIIRTITQHEITDFCWVPENLVTP